MNAIRQRRDYLWLGLLVGAASLAISPLLGDSAHAVTITGTTYAAATPPPGPLVSTSKSYNLYSLTSASANIRSDEIVSHAQSYASASVGPTGVTKTTGGLAWTDAPTTIDNLRGDVWNASASGTTIEATYNGSGMAPNTTTFQFLLPASILATADPYYYLPAAPPAGYTDPTIMQLPLNTANQTVAQGVVSNGTNLPSFFDVFVDVEATAYNGVKGDPGVTAFPLYSGSYHFDPNTGVFTSNGFLTNGVTESVKQSDDPTMPQYTLGFNGDILGTPFQAPVDAPFTVEINTSVSMGDPSNPEADTFDLTGAIDHAGVFSAGGSVTAEFLLTDPSEFTVTAVPEPSAICLAIFAAAGLMLSLRRCS